MLLGALQRVFMCAAGSWALPPSLAVASALLPKLQESISLQSTKEKTISISGVLVSETKPLLP